MSQISQDRNAQVSKNIDIKYFDISVKKFTFLLLVTLGVYGLYWTYKNWKAINLAEPAKVSPFWRTVFAIGFDFSLYSRIQRTAHLHDINMAVSGKTVAALQIVLLILSLAVSILIYIFVPIAWLSALLGALISSVSLAPAIYMQSVVNKSNATSSAKAVGIEPSWVSLLFIIGGVMQLILFFFYIVVLALLSVFAPELSEALTNPDTAELQQMIEDQQQADPAYQHVMELEDQALSCQEDLETQEALLDYSNQTAVDNYNTQFDACQAKYDEYSQAVDEYNNSLQLQ